MAYYSKNKINDEKKINATYLYETNLSYERGLQSLGKGNGFSQDLFDEGKNWAFSGKEIEEYPDEKIRENVGFVRGFNHGKRLKMIESLVNEKAKLVEDENISKKTR